MAGSPDRGIPIRLCSTGPLLAAVLFTFLLTACRPGDLLILEGPYEQQLFQNRIAPFGRSFGIRARLRGYRVEHTGIGDAADITALFSSMESVPEWVILTPSAGALLRTAPPGDTRWIFAGFLPRSSWNAPGVAVRIDRSQVIGTLGPGVVRTAQETGKTVLVYYDDSTDEARREIDLLRGILSGLDSRFIPVSRQTEPNAADAGGFDDAALVIALAGRRNVGILLASEDAQVPVVTENLMGNPILDSRLIASIEDDPKAMERAVLEILREKSPPGEFFYPARLIRGVLFDTPDR